MRQYVEHRKVYKNSNENKTKPKTIKLMKWTDVQILCSSI